jgi:hypothetical protein
MIKNIMAILGVIWALGYASSANSVNSDAAVKYSGLSIEYVGNADKPIFPIVISDSQAGADWFRASVLKRDEMELTSVNVVGVAVVNRLISAINNLSNQSAKNTEGRAQGVSVVVIAKGERKAVFFERKVALDILGVLASSCPEYPSLHDDIFHFKKRLEWMRN